jgi:hypothetical protein
MEAAGLTWPQLRVVGDEYHYQVVGRWGVEKWFRVPEPVYRGLLAIRTDSPYVFAAYVEQLRSFYASSKLPWKVGMVGEEFRPVNLADWFHERLVEWSASAPNGHATTHVFRKTSLQYALRGESTSRVAADARVSEGVLLTAYAKVTDPERRAESNRTFTRIAASLPAEVAARFGHVEVAPVPDSLVEKLKAATEARDWELVARLSAELAARKGVSG